MIIVGGSSSMRVLLSLFIETFTKATHKTAFANSVGDARTMLANNPK